LAVVDPHPDLVVAEASALDDAPQAALATPPGSTSASSGFDSWLLAEPATPGVP